MATKVHIDNWISKAQPDYYTIFIKAWIPFNAWYFAEYSTKKDSEALEKIRNTKNKVRNRIEALVTNNDSEARAFKHDLAQLHIQLDKRSIMNYECIVSFKSIVLEGFAPKPVTDVDKKGNIYKALPSITSGYRAVIIDKGGKTLMDKTFNPHRIEDFILDTQYISLKDKKVQEKIRLCFENINPHKPISLVSLSKLKSEIIILDPDSKVQFINDSELIAKAIIQILYTLRCLILHGELDPTEVNQGIYEHASRILLPIINELK